MYIAEFFQLDASKECGVTGTAGNENFINSSRPVYENQAIKLMANEGFFTNTNKWHGDDIIVKRLENFLVLENCQQKKAVFSKIDRKVQMRIGNSVFKEICKIYFSTFYSKQV